MCWMTVPPKVKNKMLLHDFLLQDFLKEKQIIGIMCVYWFYVGYLGTRYQKRETKSRKMPP